MKHIITTALGDFTVELTYSPSQGDSILNRFASVINRFATQPLTKSLQMHPELDPIKDSEILQKEALNLISLDDEAKIEKALYDSTCVLHGAGIPIRFSIKEKFIDAF